MPRNNSMGKRAEIFLGYENIGEEKRKGVVALWEVQTRDPKKLFNPAKNACHSPPARN